MPNPIPIYFGAYVCWLGSRKSIRPLKIGGWWRWALLSPDGVAPSRMVSVSASVNLPLHHKDQRFTSGTGSPGWSQKKDRKTVVVCGLELMPLQNAGKYSKNTKRLKNIQCSWNSVIQCLYPTCSVIDNRPRLSPSRMSVPAL